MANISLTCEGCLRCVLRHSFAGAPDSSLTDIDLLGTIGEPLPVGVSFTKGPNTRPAFHFRAIANVGRFARYIFPKQFFTEFSITVAIKPQRVEHGVVFAILPQHRSGIPILGLEIRKVTESTLIRLTHASDAKTKTVFDFNVPDITDKWTWLGFSIKKDGVTFYLDCNEAETKFQPANLGDLTLPSYSALYIGRAGWTPGAKSSAFQVSVIHKFFRKPYAFEVQTCEQNLLLVLLRNQYGCPQLVYINLTPQFNYCH